MNKFVEIRDGDVVWVGIRWTDSDGDTRVRKLYPSHYVGECRRAGVRM